MKRTSKKRSDAFKKLFEKSKIQDFRDLSPNFLATERAKIGNSDLSTPNTIQNHEILPLPKGKLSQLRWNMQAYQSLSNSP